MGAACTFVVDADGIGFEFERNGFPPKFTRLFGRLIAFVEDVEGVKTGDDCVGVTRLNC